MFKRVILISSPKLRCQFHSKYNDGFLNHILIKDIKNEKENDLLHLLPNFKKKSKPKCIPKYKIKSKKNILKVKKKI